MRDLSQQTAGVELNEPSQADIVDCGRSFEHAATWNNLPARQPCKFSVHEPTLQEISNEAHVTPGQGMIICADRTKVDQVTYDKHHCKAHGGVCRIGCDIRR